MRHDPIRYACPLEQPKPRRLNADDWVGMVAAVLLLVASWGLYRGWL